MKPCLPSVLFLMALAAVPAGVVAASASQQRSSHAQQEIAAFVRSEMQERQIPGLQLAVIQHGKVVLKRNFGLASLQYQVPVTDASLFSINSATKAFAGVAVMQLVQEGKVDLSAPIGQYLTGLPSAWQAVTVTQLLNHTSGLPDVLDQRRGKLVGPQPDDAAAAWTAVQALPVEAAPGQRYRYNQTNYVLLAQLIERQSGQPFTGFIRQRQFEVAGMRHSGFGDAKDVVANKASSYVLDRGGKGYRNVIEDFPVFMRAGAGINSNAGELTNWLVALQSGRLLAPDSLKRLWQPTSLNDGKPAPWALGWPTIGRDGHRAVAGIGGGRSAFYVYPDDGLAVIILSNLAGGQPEQLIDTIAGFYIPALRQQRGGAYAAHLLRTKAASAGFDGLEQKLAAIRRQHGLSAPAEDDLNAWGYRLLGRQQPKQALAVFQLGVQLYPQGANGHDSLAEAYEADGATALAVTHYRRSLELDPGNAHAVARLRVLAPD
ncbi:beta-lactamase family protein [Janthinobacterium sp. GW460P]|uniref:serine hydrolase domain-containing protein n=1 Tax=unclassified Janthinobacterium TaxID=2610881 RepID=UPI00111C513E|nr:MULTISPECIES: serine hydrolase domain-containing protein [unclassified Janthinobacterium]MCC7702954.1 beta-lactamase family protein [Janthinobacterium sp. GW460P]MCC7708462.1 beta-lactamase family protein [Janthinobacterium sp. GW460W]